MNQVSLREYVRLYGQEVTARQIGVTQGAISKALRQGRQIFLNETKNGIEAKEIKPYPSLKKY